MRSFCVLAAIAAARTIQAIEEDGVDYLLVIVVSRWTLLDLRDDLN